MNHSEFENQYNEIVKKALSYGQKARREGLLALEDEIDSEKVNERDIFEYGLRFVVDGTDSLLIDRILTNIVQQEKDEQMLILKNIQKEAVLSIQAGFNPRILYALLNSLTDIHMVPFEEILKD